MQVRTTCSTNSKSEIVRTSVLVYGIEYCIIGAELIVEFGEKRDRNILIQEQKVDELSQK